MKWFKNLKILSKLVLAFLCVALFIGVVGFIGLRNIQTINSNADTMYSQNLRSIELLTTVRQNYATIRSDLLKILYEDNQNQQDESLAQEISQLNKDNQSNMAEYEKILLTSAENTVFSQLKEDSNTYLTALNKVTDLINQNNYDEAIAAVPNATEARIKVESGLEKIIEANNKYADEAHQENNAAYQSAFISSIAFTLLGLMIALLLGTLISRMLSRQVKRTLVVAQAMEKGDLSQTIQVESKDELGAMGSALNKAMASIRHLIEEMLESSAHMTASSEELSATSEEVASMMETINNSTQQIAQGAQELSSITEDFNTATQEMSATTHDLSQKADSATASVDAIAQKAGEVKAKAADNIREGEALYDEKQARTLKAIEEGKIVNEVKIMADSIGDIAAQTNLLALNAAIEAARAGEHGRGFSVVADEVKKLAEQSAEAVVNIQSMVGKVEEAFENLSDSGKEVLDYIAYSVAPNYKFLQETGVQYEQDAQFVDNIIKQIDASSAQIDSIVSQMGESIQNITATAEESAAESEEILTSIGEVASAMNNVSQAAQNQTELAVKLGTLIQQFKI